MCQLELQAIACFMRQARESACGEIKIGFGFTFDWLGRWRGMFWPIKMKANTNHHHHHHIT